MVSVDAAGSRVCEIIEKIEEKKVRILLHVFENKVF